MIAYLIRRLLLIVPTLFGILVINFVIVQMAPGGPVEQTLAQWQAHNISAAARINGGNHEFSGGQEVSRGAQGISPELIAQLEAYYGFDQSPWHRFWQMVWNYLRFDFGSSFYHDQTVLALLIEKLPVSISLGLWSTLIVYLISIPLGIAKARRHGSRLDSMTSFILVVGYAIPGFLLAILLIVLFSGGSFFNWFPLRGLVSENFATLPWWAQIGDYFWHLALPITASVIGNFATLTLFTKNCFLEEMHRAYVWTARTKGLGESRVLYGHVARNALMLIISGLPGALVSIFFTSSLLIEIIFSLDGLGLLGFEAVTRRDYPVFFATLYWFTLIGLLLKLISDFSYTLIDPRIHFAAR